MASDTDQRAVCETRNDTYALEELEPDANRAVPECHYIRNKNGIMKPTNLFE